MADNILQRIAATKRREVEAMKRIIPEGMMRELAAACSHKPLDMSGRIKLSVRGIIAEHKRRSPSKGEISPMSDVNKVARAYASHGAAAMSVLTDTPYFGGSLEDLAVARKATPALPLLRKEFIVDDYQIYQARAYGADAVLLIASMISGEDIRRMNDLAHTLGMQTLVELHTLEELKSLPSDADMAGVNSRDLTSFNTDLRNAFNMASSLPDSMVKVAESGIKTPKDLLRLKKAGFNGFLIGEAFMSTPDPGETLCEFITDSKE